MNRKAITILTILTGAYFLISGSIKLFDTNHFHASILGYRLIDNYYAWAAAILLPWLEIFSGISTFHPRTRRTGSFLILAMMVVFQAAILSAIARGLDITCGCFGKIDTSLYFSFSRNIILMIIVSTFLYTSKTPHPKP